MDTGQGALPLPSAAIRTGFAAASATALGLARPCRHAPRPVAAGRAPPLRMAPQHGTVRLPAARMPFPWHPASIASLPRRSAPMHRPIRQPEARLQSPAPRRRTGHKPNLRMAPQRRPIPHPTARKPQALPETHPCVNLNGRPRHRPLRAYALLTTLPNGKRTPRFPPKPLIRQQINAARAQTASDTQAPLRFDDRTQASTKATPSTPSFSPGKVTAGSTVPPSRRARIARAASA